MRFTVHRLLRCSTTACQELCLCALRVCRRRWWRSSGRAPGERTHGRFAHAKIAEHRINVAVECASRRRHPVQVVESHCENPWLPSGSRSRCSIPGILREKAIGASGLGGRPRRSQHRQHRNTNSNMMHARAHLAYKTRGTVACGESIRRCTTGAAPRCYVRMSALLAC